MTDDQCEVEMREDKCDDQMTNEGHVGPVVNTNGNKLPPPPSYTDVLAFKQKLLESSSVLDLSMNAHKSSSQGKQNSQVQNLVDYSLSKILPLITVKVQLSMITVTLECLHLNQFICKIVQMTRSCQVLTKNIG